MEPILFYLNFSFRFGTQTDNMKKKILVIDDDDDIQELVRYILTKEGYEIISLKEEPVIGEIILLQPDLILLDLRMAGMGGLHICKLLKANEKTLKIPVIIFSADILLQQSMEECGADGMLAKPFDIQDLKSVILKHLP